MARISVFSLKNLLFFFVLFVLIFLGETKQPAVDVVGVGGVIAIVLYATYSLKKQRELPRGQTVAWAGLLVYLAVRSVFSDDIGYSVFTTVRYLEAFLLFKTIYCFFDLKDIKPFVDCLLGFCTVSLAAAIMWTCLPFLRGAIPHMNLLYPAYGHNHAVDILLFGLPAAIILAIQTQKNQYKILATVLLIGVIFSMSRAAMVLVGIFIIFLFGAYVVTKEFNRTRGALLLLFVFIAVSTIAVFYIGENNLLSRAGIDLQKSSLFLDSRYGYYQQAFAAIRERPFFGSGPGTFYLQSLRLQSVPQTYSWFAHNFYLEQFVELGAVGCALLLFVFGGTARLVLRGLKTRKSSIYNVALAAGIGLSLIYGFFDISLNFLVIWLLCWACVAVISLPDTSIHINKHNKTASLMSVISLVLIGAFYCVVISTYIVPNGLYTGFLDVYYTVDLIKNEKNTNLILAATTLHKKNPDVLLAAKKYKEAYFNNPQSTSLFIDYYSSLIKNNNTEESAGLFSRLITNYVSDQNLRSRLLIDVKNPTATVPYTEQSISFFGVPTNMKEGLSKILYYFGLHVISQNPQMTKDFWEAARDLSPQWGHFHVELASLYQQYFHDNNKAAEILTGCMYYVSPRVQCENALQYGIPAVGSLENVIKFIPKKM